MRVREAVEAKLTSVFRSNGTTMPRPENVGPTTDRRRAAAVCFASEISPSPGACIVARSVAIKRSAAAPPPLPGPPAAPSDESATVGSGRARFFPVLAGPCLPAPPPPDLPATPVVLE